MNLLPLESEKKRKTTPVENEQIKFSKKQKLEEDEGFRNDTTPIALKEKVCSTKTFTRMKSNNFEDYL